MVSTPTGASSIKQSSQASEAVQNRFTCGSAIVWYLSATTLLLQLLTANRYGIFRDELYYIACSKHLAFGYVDQPPLIALVAWLERHIAGDSLLSLRFLPALAGATTVWLTGRLARVLGGRRFAQAMSAMAVMFACGYLAFFHLLTMNAFEPLLFTLCAYLVVRVIQTGNQRLWLWFGVVAGIGLENKYSMGLFGVGVAAGLLLTRERQVLRQRWIWLGLAIAVLIWLPNIVWNVQHHWPFLELIHNVRNSGRDVAEAPPSFLRDQAIFMNPVTVPLWLAGAWWYFFGRERKCQRRGRYRVLGWTWLVFLGIFMALRGKSYYVWPIYALLFAGGGVALEKWLARPRLQWIKSVYAAILVAGGALLAPVTLPILPPYTFVRYYEAIFRNPPQVEHQPLGPLRQQIYADMFGWEEMTQEVARAYYSLPPDIRTKTGIAAGSYGPAAAVDFYGAKYNLPLVISGHQSYWFWGWHGFSGESLLLIHESPRRARELCDNLQVVGHVYHPLSRGDEHFDIYWCEQHRWTLKQIWPEAKHWD